MPWIKMFVTAIQMSHQRGIILKNTEKQVYIFNNTNGKSTVGAH